MTKRIMLSLVLGGLLLSLGGFALYFTVVVKTPKNNSNVVRPKVIQLEGKIGTGRSTRAFAVKGVQAAFLTTVTVTLPELPKDRVGYYSWLAKKDKSHYIKTGKLVHQSDGTYHMDFRDTKDYADYPVVLVTAESKDDGAPELTLLEGQF